MNSDVIDIIIISFLLIVGCIVTGVTLYSAYHDNANKKNKNKSSIEEKDINDDKKFDKAFKDDEDNVIKRR